MNEKGGQNRRANEKVVIDNGGSQMAKLVVAVPKQSKGGKGNHAITQGKRRREEDFATRYIQCAATAPNMASPAILKAVPRRLALLLDSSIQCRALVPTYKTPTEIMRTNANPASSRLLELRLMHHFTAKTSATFSEMESARVAWQEDIPTIAYGAQYLMDAILAVSALHLRSLYPNDQTFVRASHAYMASSIAQYSALLNRGLSELNAEALFSTSALIAFQASASRSFEDMDRGYTLPLAWFHSFQGVKAVVMASWQWLRNSNRVFPIINSQSALSLDTDPQRKLFFAPLLEGLNEQLSKIPNEYVAETRQAYEHATAFLNWAYRNPIRNRILGFAATVSRRFVELVGQKDPRSLVIISCFFCSYESCG
ncbi:hypothetical protein G7Y89_g8505 [Cudoniella acicularis]|uniref:Uncharacterized protein n=1 Tax=Cudoniella acicularis TaxID=354080 RepID=A0A8H4W3H9_9HELO|nr:hypothetical protein G7Y89_g8505 [Cudoniella acicularis]